MEINIDEDVLNKIRDDDFVINPKILIKPREDNFLQEKRPKLEDKDDFAIDNDELERNFDTFREILKKKDYLAIIPFSIYMDTFLTNVIVTAYEVESGLKFNLIINNFNNYIYMGITKKIYDMIYYMARVERDEYTFEMAFEVVKPKLLALFQNCSPYIKGITLVQQKLFVGYTRFNYLYFIKISYKYSYGLPKPALYDIQKLFLENNIEFFENDVQAYMKFTSDINMSLFRQTHVFNCFMKPDFSRDKLIEVNVEYAKENFNIYLHEIINVDFTDKVLPSQLEKEDNIKFSILSFDIECINKNKEQLIDENNKDDENTEDAFSDYENFMIDKEIEQNKHNVSKIVENGIIISISAVFYENINYNKIKHCAIFMVNNYLKIESKPSGSINSEIYSYSYDTEKEMIIEFCRYIKKIDPSFIIGYNVYNYDFPVLYLRLEHYNALEYFTNLSAISHVPSTIIFDQACGSKQTGINHINVINIPGCYVYDVYLGMKKFKLSSYKLNAVSQKFLNKSKDDISYDLIESFYKHNAVTRTLIAKYNLKDSAITGELCLKFSFIQQTMEMVKLTTANGPGIFNCGSERILKSFIRLILHFSDIIFNGCSSWLHDIEKTNYKGGFVMTPSIGYYNKPIIVLDFNSLYPSIMIQYNLCNSTSLNIQDDTLFDRLKEIKSVQDSKCVELHGSESICGQLCDNLDRNKFPDGFIKSNEYHGIIPSVLKKLISLRKKIQNLKKNTNDRLQYFIYDNQQNAIKCMTNSAYGVTGNVQSKLSNVSLAETVTFNGRHLIQKVVDFVNLKFNYRFGFRYNYNVIYGDTDSVMIDIFSFDNSKWEKLKDKMINYSDKELLNCFDNKEDLQILQKGIDFDSSTNQEIINFGIKSGMILEKAVNKYINLEYMKMAFEKVNLPFMLISKKRYCGLAYEKPNEKGKLLFKGMELARRDSFEIVLQILNEIIEMMFSSEFDRSEKIKRCKEILKKYIIKIARGDIDLNTLVRSSTIRNPLSYSMKPPHIKLFEAIKDTEVYNVGDRLPYVNVHERSIQDFTDFQIPAPSKKHIIASLHRSPILIKKLHDMEMTLTDTKRTSNEIKNKIKTMINQFELIDEEKDDAIMSFIYTIFKTLLKDKPNDPWMEVEQYLKFKYRKQDKLYSEFLELYFDKLNDCMLKMFDAARRKEYISRPTKTTSLLTVDTVQSIYNFKRIPYLMYVIFNGLFPSAYRILKFIFSFNDFMEVFGFQNIQRSSYIKLRAYSPLLLLIDKQNKNNKNRCLACAFEYKVNKNEEKQIFNFETIKENFQHFYYSRTCISCNDNEETMSNVYLEIDQILSSWENVNNTACSVCCFTYGNCVPVSTCKNYFIKRILELQVEFLKKIAER